MQVAPAYSLITLLVTRTPSRKPFGPSSLWNVGPNPPFASSPGSTETSRSALRNCATVEPSPMPASGAQRRVAASPRLPSRRICRVRRSARPRRGSAHSRVPSLARNPRNARACFGAPRVLVMAASAVAAGTPNRIACAAAPGTLQHHAIARQHRPWGRGRRHQRQHAAQGQHAPIVISPAPAWSIPPRMPLPPSPSSPRASPAARSPRRVRAARSGRRASGWNGSMMSGRSRPIRAKL